MKDQSNMANGWSLALIERAKVYITGRAFGISSACIICVCVYVHLTMLSIVMISCINCDHPYLGLVIYFQPLTTIKLDLTVSVSVGFFQSQIVA